LKVTQHSARLLTRASRALLGEGPVWDERSQTLYWVDIERGVLHQCKADGSGESSVSVGQRLGCVALRRDAPGFIAGFERGLALLTPGPLEILPLASFDSEPAGHRCNDGKCDAEGRFWVGTYNTHGTAPTAWLFRFDGSGPPVHTAGPFLCTNGPAFSPDGRTLYCADSYGRVVHRYRLDPSGELSAAAVFCSFEPEGWGYPDGLTCDAEGCVWIAHWGGSRVSRFSPRGELLEIVQLPVLQPTSCTFGGADLCRLFITSAAVGLDAAANPDGLAGAVFAVDVAAQGLPAARYRG
jgi:xylono-1,5-lactonase